VVALITGPVGFVVALSALAYETYKADQAILSLIDANTKLIASQDQGRAIHDRAVSSLERFAQTSGLAVKSIDEADKLISSGTVVWSTATNGWVKAGDALADVAQAASSAQADFRKSEIAMQNQADAAEKSATSTGKLASAQKDVSKYTLETVPIYDKLTGAITGYEQQLVKSAKGTIDLGAASGKAATDLTKITAETDKAKESTKKWAEELAKMSHEKELKLIEAQSKITTAQLEADAKKAVAAYESLGLSIKSTGDVLSTLFGQVKDFGGMDWGSIRLIETQIEKENALREKSFQLQQRLTNATIKQMEAQTNALNKGDGLIKISGDGLKPHLEAFMWEILKTIQVRVNADGLKMLLGT
jgi:hypothetical protein